MKTHRQIVWAALALLLILILIGPTQKANDEWQSWKEEFGIEFGSPVEEMYRRRIFYNNLNIIQQHNSNPHATYTLGTNQFSMLTQQEF